MKLIQFYLPIFKKKKETKIIFVILIKKVRTRNFLVERYTLHFRYEAASLFYLALILFLYSIHLVKT